MHDRDEYREDRLAEHGYLEVSEREVRLREWQDTREDAGFEKLVARLRSREWVRKVYRDGGPRLDALRKKNREWAAAKRAANLRAHRNAENERRRAQRRKTPIICRCVECGATWCRVVWVRGIQPSFCSEACSARYRYHRRALARGQTSRRADRWAHLGEGLGLVAGSGRMNGAATVRARVLAELGRREVLTCLEARALCEEIHRSTYCQAIQQLRRAGAIVVEGRGVRARYRLAAGSREGEP